MRDAFTAAGEDEWTGGAVIAHADPAAYLEILASWSEGRNLPPNWGPADCYLIFANDSVVGQLDVRHPITEYLEQWGGHIGYHVHPSYRNRGVATWALRAALEILASKGVPEALLTCAHDNAASIRVIEKCGGRRIADSTRWRYLIPTNLETFLYSETRDLHKEAVLALYRANNWSAAQKGDLLYKALVASHSLVTAWDRSKLIGLGNAISDGYLVVYYPHLLVLPDYQGRGIGTEVMRRLMMRYKGFHQHMLVADGRALDFYRKCGFKRAGATESMWMYSGSDH